MRKMKNSFSFFLWLTKEGPPVLSVASVPSDLPFRRMTSYVFVREAHDRGR
jgi:hypothetical protein